MSTSEQMRPEQMRTAVARYVEEIHRAYVAQAMTFPAAVRGRMPLLAPGPLTVAAVGARNLHVLATRDSLGPVHGPEVELTGSVEGLTWTVRFFDPVVLPELSLIDESSGPAFGEVRHALGELQAEHLGVVRGGQLEIGGADVDVGKAQDSHGSSRSLVMLDASNIPRLVFRIKSKRSR